MSKNEELKIVLKKVGEEPEIMNIEDTFEAKQKLLMDGLKLFQLQMIFY